MQKRDSKKTRQIVEAARQLFLAKGYVAVSMDAIAQEVGVTKQTVYRYFPSKEKLFEAVLESLAAVADWNEPGRFQGVQTAKALCDFARSYLKFHMQPDHIAAVRLIISERQKVPELSQIFFKAGQAKTIKKLATFLSERFTNHDDPYGTAKYFLGMLSSVLDEKR